MRTHSPAGPRNPSPPIGGGTPGGLASRLPAGGMVPQGDALYLWALVMLEVLAIAWLRHAFKRYHGG